MSVSRNNSLFWRLWWRAVSVKRPQAALTVGALLLGAAVTSMLVNLYGGVRRKMSQDLRAYGANVMIVPHTEEGTAAPRDVSIGEDSLRTVAEFTRAIPGSIAVPVLYAAVHLSREPADPRLPEFETAVAVGADFEPLHRVNSGWRLTGESSLPPGTCAAGWRVAARLHERAGDSLLVRSANQNTGSPLSCRLATILTTGAAEDDQVFLPLSPLQSFLGLDGAASVVELSIPGGTKEVEGEVRRLAALAPGLDVRPIRQIVYSEGKVLGTIRWMMLSLTVLILVIIVLCVMATLTAIILERRKDVGVMKALGATDRRLMWLFVVEGASLGLVSGAVGFGAGALLARGVASRLFGVALGIDPRMLPVICLMTVALAVLAAQAPVRLVLKIQPATVLKGE